MLSSRTIRLCGPDAGMGSPVKASTTARFWRTGVLIDPRHASRGLVAAQDLRETNCLIVMFNVCSSQTWLSNVACSRQYDWRLNTLAEWEEMFLTQATFPESWQTGV